MLAKFQDLELKPTHFGRIEIWALRMLPAAEGSSPLGSADVPPLEVVRRR